MSAEIERWVWLDLEMTGLDDKSDTILQIAAVITDGNFKEIASCDLPIWHPQETIDRIGPFVKKMHTDNGLLRRVQSAPHTLADAERKVLEMVSAHVNYKKGILAGNSIWQDRRFLLRYMPALENFLHYRMIDVSTMKVLFSAWFGDKGLPEKKMATHTALEDIRASIEECKYYKDHCIVETPR